MWGVNHNAFVLDLVYRLHLSNLYVSVFDNHVYDLLSGKEKFEGINWFFYIVCLYVD